MSGGFLDNAALLVEKCVLRVSTYIYRRRLHQFELPDCFICKTTQQLRDKSVPRTRLLACGTTVGGRLNQIGL